MRLKGSKPLVVNVVSVVSRLNNDAPVFKMIYCSDLGVRFKGVVITILPHTWIQIEPLDRRLYARATDHHFVHQEDEPWRTILTLVD